MVLGDRTRIVRAVRLLVTAALLCAPCAAQGQITLVNATAESGIAHTHAADATCMGSQAWQTGGMAVGDFNNDGWPDLYVIGGGIVADKLYINNGAGGFANVAPAWGLTLMHGGCGASVADYDRDGWQDIYVTSFGNAGAPGQIGKHRLLRNTGNGSFSDVAVSAGVNQTTTQLPNGYGSAWGDYDLDGDLDLFVASWKDIFGLGNNGTGNKLFRNDGNGTFTNVTSTAMPNAMFGVWGFQPAFVDMDGDRYPELLLAADFETSRYLKNNADGTFTNWTAQSGTGLDDNGMGQTVGDFNNDGRLDWYVTSIHMAVPNQGHHNGNMLYMSQGGHVYTETSVPSGVNDGGWGWGTLALDLDNDGWLDLVEINGRPTAEWANERGYLWHNNGDPPANTFTEIGIQAGFDHVGEGRAMAWMDADRDGDQDFFVFVNNGTLLYYRNDTPKAGNWIHLEFDTSAHDLLPPQGYGTRVTVITGEHSQIRYLSGSPSYLATSEAAMHVGVGAAEVIDRIEIHWSRGQTSVLTDVQVNQFLEIQAPLAADVTADGLVNVIDLLSIISRWGLCPAGTVCAEDVNGDGTVNEADLMSVLKHWS